MPASLGYALGTPSKRVVVVVGDGAFQMTCQELLSLTRYLPSPPIVVLINNSYYTIELEIHDGPYNQLLPFDYKSFAEAVDCGRGHVLALKATTEAEVAAAFKAAAAATDKLALIECVVDKADVSVELLQFGRLMAAQARK